MLPSELYFKRSRELSLTADPQQEIVIKQFDKIYKQLSQAKTNESGFLKNLFNRKKTKLIKGLYIWGGVGRGKTMLMDIFYDTLKTSAKKRLHFHHFMHDIHDALKDLKNTENPLDIIADNIANEIKILCLDEFHVNDIADAMLLAGLLEALFSRNVSLITTSNRIPDDLYKDGLQRARFIPAIELLKKNTKTINLDNDTDYRLLTLKRDGTYYCPLNKDAERHIEICFNDITSCESWNSENIIVNGRAIPIKGEAEGAVWFEFDAICNTPRSQDDYLEIACEHHSVFISNLPNMDDAHNDAARRLLNLLDILYDHKVKLIISADSKPTEIYSGKKLSFEFDRASSRLIEMQSEEYLAQTHLP